MGKKAEYILDKYVVNHNTQRKAAIYSQIHTFAYLESPVKLTCISLDCGRQPEPTQVQGEHANSTKWSI